MRESADPGVSMEKQLYGGLFPNPSQ